MCEIYSMTQQKGKCNIDRRVASVCLLQESSVNYYNFKWLWLRAWFSAKNSMKAFSMSTFSFVLATLCFLFISALLCSTNGNNFCFILKHFYVRKWRFLLVCTFLILSWLSNKCHHSSVPLWNKRGHIWNFNLYSLGKTLSSSHTW